MANKSGKCLKEAQGERGQSPQSLMGCLPPDRGAEGLSHARLLEGRLKGDEWEQTPLSGGNISVLDTGLLWGWRGGRRREVRLALPTALPGLLWLFPRVSQ